MKRIGIGFLCALAYTAGLMTVSWAMFDNYGFMLNPGLSSLIIWIGAAAFTDSDNPEIGAYCVVSAIIGAIVAGVATTQPDILIFLLRYGLLLLL